MKPIFSWLLIALLCLLLISTSLVAYQMAHFNNLFERRIFFPSPAKFEVVPLTKDRFVIVDGGSISVYRVDKDGSSTILSRTQ